ncbi:MAG TPA: hypothetical protein VFQ36_17645 [Ktedonobacteraceae bacterium]|nr:hypothetical protein [Ktedonobacteraceae bacterium]
MNNNTSLEAKHVNTWGRAAQAARCYMLMAEQPQEQDDQELKEARALLITELAALLEIAKRLDTASPLWKQVFYVQATRNMIAACGITQQEIDDYQRVV